MSILQNKIDFVALVSVHMANPNGDPLDGNRPRQDYNGLGEMSDVCIGKSATVCRIWDIKFLYSPKTAVMMDSAVSVSGLPL